MDSVDEFQEGDRRAAGDAYIPEFEDVVEGERLLGCFPSLWQWTPVPVTVDHASGSETLEGTGFS